MLKTMSQNLQKNHPNCEWNDCYCKIETDAWKEQMIGEHKCINNHDFAVALFLDKKNSKAGLKFTMTSNCKECNTIKSLLKTTLLDITDEFERQYIYA